MWADGLRHALCRTVRQTMMVRPFSSNMTEKVAAHKHWAGRVPVGRSHPVTVSKCGIVHQWRMPDGSERDMHVIGAACSEIFSGSRLASVLKRGHALESAALDALDEEGRAPCLSIHTSAGTPAPLPSFLESLEEHLPAAWSEDVTHGDWFASLQLEGASAVWAAIDLCWQLQQVRGCNARTKIAVGEYSYHGPPSSSYGRGAPMGPQKDQITYPVPAKILRRSGETEEDHHTRVEAEYDAWLDRHGDDVAVMLVEPQWGSSLAAQPWPQHMLRRFVRKAQARGILVCADEIMCGLFRHGKGTLFLSDAWDINPDAVTFGKSVAAGMFPLSGVIMKGGAHELHDASRTVYQSHTYAGSSVRALMTGAAVLETVPSWCENITKLETVCREGFNTIRAASHGRMLVHGQGLMWGAMLDSSFDEDARKRFLADLRRRCEDAGPWPYFVPSGGVMVTPVYDACENELKDALSKLSVCIGDSLSESILVIYVLANFLSLPFLKTREDGRELERSCSTKRLTTRSIRHLCHFGMKAAARRKRRKVTPPLGGGKSNGIISVRWGKNDRKVLDYSLVSIHYRLDEKTGVAVCTLNEPSMLNALTENQMWEYMLILRHAERDNRVKVLVWTGRGRAFSSGADLSGRAPAPTLPDEVMEWFMTQGFAPGHADPDSPDMALKCLTLCFWDFKKISIVAVNGLAVGGAVNIALANYHDIVLASENARFMYPFSKIGLTPELGSSYILPRIVGMANAKKLLMLGDWFSAAEAKEIGLVSEVLHPSLLMRRAVEIAQTLASRHQGALRLNKAVINSHIRKSMGEIMDRENDFIEKSCKKPL